MYAIDSGLRAEDFVRQANWRIVVAYGVALMAALVVLLLSLFSHHYGFPISAAVYLFGLAGIAVRPIFGVYAITFLGLLADNTTASYWPFLKNGSSYESWLYVHDKVIFSPLETYLVWTLVVTMIHVALRRVTLRPTPLFIPIAAFMAFVVVGLAWGIGTGGNLNIALWEVRPFGVLFILYLLAANLITTRSQVRGLFWTAIAAILVEGIRTAIWYVSSEESHLFDSLVEHPAATHMNFLFISVFLAWLIAGSGVGLRFFLPLLAIPTLWAYMESERRSAIAALIIGVIMVLFYLKIENFGRFMVVAPILVILISGYTAAFWNAEGALAFPAEAIRAQIAPEEASAADQASDKYRELERYNILATLRSNPALGVGFGQKYDQPYPLPDIGAFFIWWEYVTHNALLWIWLKTGAFGFIALFNLVGRSIVLGMRNAIRERKPMDKVMVAAAPIFISMYLLFTYVDIAWGTQSMIMLAVCLTIIAKSGQFLVDEAESESAEAQIVNVTSSSTSLVEVSS